MDKANHVKLLLNSYKKFVHSELINRTGDADQDLAIIESAEFILVSHDGTNDPILNYGNNSALDLWELSWGEFVKTPSRKTAELDLREKRQEMLMVVEKQGCYKNYSGVRVSSTGKRFMIKDTVVWNVVNEIGEKIGQAATFKEVEFL